MIGIEQNERDFEYDVHSLVQAFYPGEEVSICHDGIPAEASVKISVFYEKDRISVLLLSDGGLLKKGSAFLPEEAGNHRPEKKNILKKLLYEMLCDQTGKKLPWGDLTGIRPTKIAMSLLREGKSTDQASQWMREKYYVSREKAGLAAEIACREKRLLQERNYRDGFSLYVGIPFCPSICLYCSFSSSPISVWRDRVEDYLCALFQEIESCSRVFEGKRLDTVYIGGGTPTTLEPSQLDRLLTVLEDHFDYSHLRELTVEAGRPDSITGDKLKVLSAHRISRISVNPQTMNQRTLDIIGRRHTVEQTKAAFLLAREEGFSNINMDLIVGLPREGEKEVALTMRQISDLCPESVTVHSLALKRAARLNLMKDEYRDTSFVNSADIMRQTENACRQMGLFPYYLYRQKNMAGNFENVGYAAEGKEGLYNILMMEEVQSILALGAGASTKIVYPDDHIERVENVKDIRNYIDRIDEMIERKRKIHA